MALSSSSSSSSSSSATLVTREEFNAFHKCDRDLFSRLVLTLRRDINQSYQVMSFLIYLEKSSFRSNLIVRLVSSPDVFINAVADEVVMCLSCLSYADFSLFVANSGKNVNSIKVPLISNLSGKYQLTAIIHQNREDVLLQMNKYLTQICYPAFEDISLHAEKMYSDQEKDKTKQLVISSNQFLSEEQETRGASFSENEQVLEDERTIFLTFSKGYPISEAEVHAYFTRRFGVIIEAIKMPEVEGNEQALYATMVLHSAAKIPEIVSSEKGRTKYIINGKHVWARRFIPRSSINNLPPSSGLTL